MWPYCFSDHTSYQFPSFTSLQPCGPFRLTLNVTSMLPSQGIHTCSPYVWTRLHPGGRVAHCFAASRPLLRCLPFAEVSDHSHESLLPDSSSLFFFPCFSFLHGAFYHLPQNEIICLFYYLCHSMKWCTS